MPNSAQEEFDAYTAGDRHNTSAHPEDIAYTSDISEPSSPSSKASSPRPSASSSTMPHAVYQIPNTHFDANTGPKGVIADAQSFDRARKRTLRQTIYSMTSAVGSNVIGVSERISSSVRSSSSNRRGSGSSSEASDAEDEFMKSWREKRIHELKNGSEIRTRRLSPSKRRYGSLVKVDALGYLDAVEKVASDVMVVVMISDEDSPISGMVENALSNLARKHEFTRFVRLPYWEAEMDAAGVPAILAYQGGELVANLVSIIDQIPENRDLSVSSVEDLLKSRRVLS